HGVQWVVVDWCGGFGLRLRLIRPTVTMPWRIHRDQVGRISQRRNPTPTASSILQKNLGIGWSGVYGDAGTQVDEAFLGAWQLHVEDVVAESMAQLYSQYRTSSADVVHCCLNKAFALRLGLQLDIVGTHISYRCAVFDLRMFRCGQFVIADVGPAFADAAVK